MKLHLSTRKPLPMGWIEELYKEMLSKRRGQDHQRRVNKNWLESGT